MSNIAMLELYVTLFLGLLLKVEVVSEEESDSAVFTGLVVVLTAFIFVFPLVSIALASSGNHSSRKSAASSIRRLRFGSAAVPHIASRANSRTSGSVSAGRVLGASWHR